MIAQLKWVGKRTLIDEKSEIKRKVVGEINHHGVEKMVQIKVSKDGWNQWFG